MSDPENFIARWSRKKRELERREEPAKQEAGAQAAEATSSPQAGDPLDHGKSSKASPAANVAAEKVPFDVASLPSLESITAESDIRAFLAPGVPVELTRAALRRAWSADPKIRDFVGLAENSWDFNAPGAISGFGTLEMTDELRREIARMVGRSLGTEGADTTVPTPSAEPDGQASVETTGESNAAIETAPMVQAQSNDGTSQDEPMDDKNELYNSDMYLQRSQENIATQYAPEKPDNVQLIVKRPHGRALPK